MIVRPASSHWYKETSQFVIRFGAQCSFRDVSLSALPNATQPKRLAVMPPKGSTRAGILPSCPSPDRGSREAEIGLEKWAFLSVNSRSRPETSVKRVHYTDAFNYFTRTIRKNYKKTAQQNYNGLHILSTDAHSMLSVKVEPLSINLTLTEITDYDCDLTECNGKDMSIPVLDLKELLLICAQNVQFTFN
ncbi:hypothetical protein T265_01159 [Opisthorchis viverrini]|uniref:Uncharacterized protein n=1 Tax=Opisthorchis viverrini TaxID=6198 RepID=A0A074ZZI2_OPIVI|nr:hypothetical protein T265_01159 [Opisthorchis viverrini]KER32873.1 hypothetical protein T265_01159 [Opisthorchis viverrini]